MKIEISFDSDQLSIAGEEELVMDFSEQLKADPAFQLRRPLRRERGVDPAVLIALAGPFATVLAAVITGTLSIAKKSASKKIVIHLENGRKLEVPVDISSDNLDRLIERLKEPDEKPVKILLL